MMSVLLANSPREVGERRCAASAISESVTSAQLLLAAHASAAARMRPFGVVWSSIDVLLAPYIGEKGSEINGECRTTPRSAPRRRQG